MASPRRIAGPNAKNRGVLLDAAEQLLLEEGYAAVTSRRVAAAAGLKPQLVHYYFRTMDDLFLGVFRRRAEVGIALLEEALASSRPLHAIWEHASDPRGGALTMELAALANHRPGLRAEIARYAERYRALQTVGLERALERYAAAPDALSPPVLSVLLTGLSIVMVMEQALGVAAGHAEAMHAVARYLESVEPE